MSSPFPGMDPYLEDPQLWPSVHHWLISQIGTTLNRLLPPGYVAAFGERVFVAGPDRDIYPDVFVKDLADGSAAKACSRGGTATAVSDPPWVVAIASDEIVESFIEIRGVTGDQPIVTTIEALSPRNKTAASEGRQLYRQKQREILSSETHLLEIDLLRSGQHTVAAPREALLRRGLEPMKKVARCLREHEDPLMNWFKARGEISAGAVEGWNLKAKLSMRKASGFRTLEGIETALSHQLGHLPEPEFTHKSC